MSSRRTYGRKTGRVSNPQRRRRATASVTAVRAAPRRRAGVGRAILRGISFIGKRALGPALGIASHGLGAGAYGPAATLGAHMVNAVGRRMFPAVKGQGDYTVVRNTMVNPRSYGTSKQIGLMHGDNGSTRVRHREYVRDMPGSIGFRNITFAINPTNPQLFPWLSALAQNYEQYKILGMIFEFRSLSASALNSVNTALGSVSLATQYNSLDQPFVNKQQVLNYMFGTSCKPSESMTHPVECDPSQTPNQPLYVRLTTQAAGDPRLFDFGVLNYCTIGMQADVAIIGELWVSYDILLIKPRLSSGLGLGLRSAFYTCSADRNLPETTYLVENDAPFGQLATARFDSIGLEFEYKLGSFMDTTIKFPIGCEGLYLLQLTWFGNGTPTGASQTRGEITYVNCTPRSQLYNVTPISSGQADVGLNAGVSGCNTMSMDNIIAINDPNQAASIEYKGGPTWFVPPSDINSVMNVVAVQLNAQITPPASTTSLGYYRYQPLEDEEKFQGPHPAGLLRAEEPDDDEFPVMIPPLDAPTIPHNKQLPQPLTRVVRS